MLQLMRYKNFLHDSLSFRDNFSPQTNAKNAISIHWASFNSQWFLPLPGPAALFPLGNKNGPGQESADAGSQSPHMRPQELLGLRHLLHMGQLYLWKF